MLFGPTSRAGSAKGAFGRHDRHDSAGRSLLIAASGCRSSRRRSMAFVVRRPGSAPQIPMPRCNGRANSRRKSHRHALGWRAFQASINRSPLRRPGARSRAWPPPRSPVTARRSSSILRRLKPIPTEAKTQTASMPGRTKNVSEWPVFANEFLRPLNQRVQGSNSCAPTNKISALEARRPLLKKVVSALCPR